jgi:hypothetical protein
LGALADETFSPVYLRASTAYGISLRIRFDLVVNNLTAWAFTTKQVYLKSDGTPWRPVVHVEDIARAYIAALHAPRALVHNEAFNVGTTTENYQIRELAEMVQDIVPDCRIHYAPDAGPDKRCYRVDCNKIAKTLPGFKPQWTARRGVQELHEAYCKASIKPEEFEGSRFKRIAHIRHLISEGVLTDELLWRTEGDKRRIAWLDVYTRTSMTSIPARAPSGRSWKRYCPSAGRFESLWQGRANPRRRCRCRWPDRTIER